MNRTTKSLALLALGITLMSGGAAQAVQFSAAMVNDWYNGNTPNGIPTPQFTPDLGYDMFNAANLVNFKFGYTKNENLDTFKTAVGSYQAGDMRLVTQDHSFDVASGSTVSFFVLGMSAANTNNLGFYQRTTDGQTIIKTSLLTGVTGFQWTGSGAQADPFLGVTFTAPTAYSGGTATTLGWYVESTSWRDGSVKNYYSETQLNPDGYDHLITYALPELKGKTFWYKDQNGNVASQVFSDNAYLIGFEDAIARYVANYDTIVLGDEDYNDLLILVNSNFFTPSDKPPVVPEPGTFVLLGAGLAGLWTMNRRKRH